MKTMLKTTITVVVVCGVAMALSYLFGARGASFRVITAVTWTVSILTAYTFAGISLARDKRRKPSPPLQPAPPSS